MAKWMSVQVGKIDLDTAGVAFLMGVTREKKVEALRSGRASKEDLANPLVLCIEVGGSGRTPEGNFDHHDYGEGAPEDSATWQAWERLQTDAARFERTYNSLLGLDIIGLPLDFLVDYIDELDVRGPRGLDRPPDAEFPYLSDVFAGMLLTKRDPVEQLHCGVEILREIVRQGIDPLGSMPIEEIPGWQIFAEAKAENNRQIAEAVKQAQWTTTEAGRRLAFLETKFFGAPGALYGHGAEIVVAFSPTFGEPPVPKFTVAGNGIKVDAALPELTALESGWGGPPTGTILGSPREGSSLSLEQVVRIVQKTC